MAIAPIRPGHLRIDRQKPAYVQFQLGTQNNTITPEHVGACERQTPSAEATERGEQDTTLLMSQLLRGPNRSAIRHTYEGAQRRRQKTR